MLVKEMFELLFDECKHGDQEHQDWLEAKFTDFIDRLGIKNSIIKNYEIDEKG